MKQIILVILDGWGYAKPGPGNAVTLAKTPAFSQLWEKYPRTLLTAHGERVGLPDEQEGNSEAGHLNLGAGRVVLQDSVYISRSIHDFTFFKNTAFLEVLKHARKYNTKVHLLGLLSNGESAHSIPEHLYAVLQMLHQQKMEKVFLHLFTDGRDSPQFAAQRLLKDIEQHFCGQEKIATIIGRFYAMDRNKIWSRTELAYHTLVLGEGIAVNSPSEAIERAYRRGESDEFIAPTVIVDKKKRPIATIDDNDVIIFFNLRSDRARQLTKCFVQADFNEKNPGAFSRKKFPKNIRFCAMTDFGPDLPHVFTAFSSRDIYDGLAASLKDYKQIYIAESEKYSHVTYFFNGGFADPIAGEKRVRVPSPLAPRYDAVPEMSAAAVTGAGLKALKDKMNFICINFANPDMLGHTGNLQAGIKAVEFVDHCLGDLLKKAGEETTLIITADHGNIEEMLNLETGEINTEHSTNPVPFILVNKNKFQLRDNGILADVAPTILELLNLSEPAAMTGRSLMK